MFNVRILEFVSVSLLAASAGLSQGQAADGLGILKPVALPAYQFASSACTAPTDLQRSLIFFQDNDRQFMEGVRLGLEEAANRRGLTFSVALANNDPQKMISGVEAAASSKVGALVAAPIDAAGLAPALITAINSGTYVGTVVPPPAVTILNAPQYLTGEVLAKAAADYIVKNLDGQANVVLLTHDSLEFLSPRFTAMRDVLGRLPGVTIVADISPSPVNVEGGYEMMKLILLANPRIDVVLGADTVVLGALKALREAGLASPTQFLGGIDGEPGAIAEVSDRESPYKVTVSLASPVFGYALGNFAADWLEGKRVPQAMDILPRAIDASNLESYKKEVSNPADIFNNPVDRDRYLKFYGSICFETRSEFLNFPWSSDR
jgi:ribose transport system substrate-binding protein